MKKFIGATAAAVLLAGAGVVTAPVATAYPAGSDPAIGIVGGSRVPRAGAVAARAANFKPGCVVVLSVSRTTIKRSRKVAANGGVNFGFRAPATRGTYRIRAVQVSTPTCPVEVAATRLRVVR